MPLSAEWELWLRRRYKEVCFDSVAQDKTKSKDWLLGLMLIGNSLADV